MRIAIVGVAIAVACTSRGNVPERNASGRELEASFARSLRVSSWAEWRDACGNIEYVGRQARRVVVFLSESQCHSCLGVDRVLRVLRARGSEGNSVWVGTARVDSASSCSFVRREKIHVPVVFVDVPSAFRTSARDWLVAARVEEAGGVRTVVAAITGYALLDSLASNWR